MKKRKAKTGKNVLDLYFTENHANPAMRVNVRHHAIEEDNTLIEITTRQGGTHYSLPDASKNINSEKVKKKRGQHRKYTQITSESKLRCMILLDELEVKDSDSYDAYMSGHRMNPLNCSKQVLQRWRNRYLAEKERLSSLIPKREVTHDIFKSPGHPRTFTASGLQIAQKIIHDAQNLQGNCIQDNEVMQITLSQVLKKQEELAGQPTGHLTVSRKRAREVVDSMTMYGGYGQTTYPNVQDILRYESCNDFFNLLNWYCLVKVVFGSVKHLSLLVNEDSSTMKYNMNPATVSNCHTFYEKKGKVKNNVRVVQNKKKLMTQVIKVWHCNDADGNA